MFCVTGCHWMSQGTMFCVTECHWMSLNIWSDNASCHWHVRWANVLCQWMSVSAATRLHRVWDTCSYFVWCGIICVVLSVQCVVLPNCTVWYRRSDTCSFFLFCVALPVLYSVVLSVWYCPAVQCGTDWVTHAAILPPFCRVNLALPPRPRHSVHNAMNCADNADTNMFTNTDTNTDTATDTNTNTHLGQSSVN